MRTIIVEPHEPSRSKFAIAERKGIGHPDTLIDRLCNAASNALSAYYLDKYGKVLHHNVDKGLIVAGKSEPRFGGGRIINPMEIFIAGRATSRVDGDVIDVDTIISTAVEKELASLKHLADYRVFVKVKEGAHNLQQAFERKQVANDTSFGVAHAPLSPTEKLALDVANFLNGELSKKIPAIGEDVKVMATLVKTVTKLTLAIAFVDKFVSSMDDYIRLKERVKNEVRDFVGEPCEIELNLLDDVSRDASTIYLTVTGLSAEHGDDGQVGRGNRPSGLITPDSPMSLEAAAGKNVNHPGKLNQILAQIVAERITALGGIDQCCVKLVTQIGRPLDDQLVWVGFSGKQPITAIEKEVDSVLDNIPDIQIAIIDGKYGIF